MAAVNLQVVRDRIDDTRRSLASWQYHPDAQDEIRATNNQLAQLKEAITQYVLKGSPLTSDTSHVSTATEECNNIIVDINTLLVDSKSVKWGLAAKIRMAGIRKRLEASIWYFNCPPKTLNYANRPPPTKQIPQVLPGPVLPRQQVPMQTYRGNIYGQPPQPVQPQQAQGQQQHQRNIYGQPYHNNGQFSVPIQAPPPYQPVQKAQGQPYYGNGQPSGPTQLPGQARQPNQGIKIAPARHPIRTWPQKAQGQQTQRSKPEPAPVPGYALPLQLPYQAAPKRPAWREAKKTWEAPPQVAEAFKQAPSRGQNLQPTAAHYQKPQGLGIPEIPCPVYVYGPATLNVNINLPAPVYGRPNA